MITHFLLCSEAKSVSPSVSCVWFFVTIWILAHQILLSMEFYKQEHWSGLPFLSPGDLPNPVIELSTPALQADSLWTEPPAKPFLCRRNIKIKDKEIFIFSVSRMWDNSKKWPLKTSSIICTETFIEDQLPLTTALCDINIWFVEGLEIHKLCLYNHLVNILLLCYYEKIRRTNFKQNKKNKNTEMSQKPGKW